MKRRILLLTITVLAMTLVTAIAFGYEAGKGIRTTPHDLSTKGRIDFGDATEQGTGGLDRVCIYCHAPHNTIKPGSLEANGIAYLPLWNHAVTVQEYTMYTNGLEEPNDKAHASKAEELLANEVMPGSVSRLCLSCHDASVATNSYGGKTGSKYVAGNYLIGANNDLSNHHPIGFTYATVQASDNEIASTGASVPGTALTINDLLWNGKMECTSCHDVHNTKNKGEKFLWVSDAQSNFCMTCHLKDAPPTTP